MLCPCLWRRRILRIRCGPLSMVLAGGAVPGGLRVPHLPPCLLSRECWDEIFPFVPSSFLVRPVTEAVYSRTGLAHAASMIGRSRPLCAGDRLDGLRR